MGAEAAAPQILDGIDRGQTFVRLDVAHDHVRTGAGQNQSDAAADPLSGAADQGDSIGQ